MDHLLTCPVCYDPFDSDPSLFSTDDDRRTSHLPVFSAACSHKMCCSCLNSWQLAAISDQTDRAATKNPPKWFKCPCCTQKTAFNAVDMKVDLYACGWIGQLKRQPHLFDNNPASIEEENTKDFHETAESFLEMGSTRRVCHIFEEPTTIADVAKASGITVAALVEKKNSNEGQRKAIENALSKGKSFEELREMFRQVEETHVVETFLKNGSSRRCLPFDYFGGTTFRRKKRESKLTKVVIGDDIVSKPRKRQRKTIITKPKKRRRKTTRHFDGISKIVARSRIGIFWPMDKVFYPATVVSKKEKTETTFTILYDDGVTESIDLSREKFIILNDAASFHSTGVSDMSTCIDQSNDNGDEASFPSI